ncbi:protein phosphatase 2c domain-containing protein [Cystoisospora suis]|uniref:Protein phosphatase 2c domain-containing protein n=1 Tax=Cystoisospora suis TaxID=483139 RepID=A0A2C6K2F5_9APIC|nr:protein phosphatase 2c domain-containing protein [Cystoisospora suis]
MSELKTRKKKKITRESGESPAGGDKERGRDHQDEEEDEDEDVSERKYLVELYLAHAGDTRAVLGVTTSPGPFSVEETGSHLSFDGVASSSYISRGEERDRHGKNEVDKRDRERGMRKKDHGERRSPLEKRDEREGGGEKDEEEEEEENEEEHGDNTMEKKKKSCLVGKTRTYTRMKGERLTSDHKPNRSDEKSRIERHGGSVIDLGCPRVMAGSVDMALAVSRCLGDFALKEVSEHIIIATPEVSTRRLTPERDAFVIIASDGLWDVLTDDDAVSIVQRRLDRYFHRGREGRDGRHDLKNAKSKERMGMPVMAPSRRGSSTIISARGGGGRLSIEINKGENKMIQDKKQKKDGWYDEGEDVEEEEEEDGHTISSSYGGRNEEEDEEGREQHESACNNSRTEFKANEGECSWWETSRSHKIRVADLTRKTKEKEEKKKGRDDKERNQDEEEEEMKNRRINSKGEEGGENLTSRPNGVKKKRLPPRNQGEVEEEDADTFEDYAPKEILEDAANELIRVALSRRSQDNITVLILHFSWRLKKKHNTSTVKMT